MADVKTVRIKHGKGSRVINASDYDEKEHGKPVADPKPKDGPKEEVDTNKAE